MKTPEGPLPADGLAFAPGDGEDETRLALALQAADLGIWDWNLLDGTMTWSLRAKEIYGFPPDQPVTLAQVRAATHPEDLPRTQEISRRAQDPSTREKVPYEFRIIRADGKVRWVNAHGEVRFAEIDGAVRAVRYTGTLQDVTDRWARESRLRLALEAGRLAVWDWDARTDTISGSRELYDLLGFGSDERPTTEEIRARYYPGDREKVVAEAWDAINRGDRFIEAALRYIWPDGQVRWLLLRGEVVLDADSMPASIVGVVMDVTDRKRVEEHQAVLVRELNHRVKNTLALVQAIASQTFRGAPDIETGRRVFSERLAALSLAHDTLTRGDWSSTTLDQLVPAILQPHRDVHKDQFSIGGPEVHVSPQSAVSLAMVLHELSTNAAKYGALASAQGRVRVDWREWREGDEMCLSLTWSESGGACVERPTRKGFGSQLVKRGWAAGRTNTVEIDYRAEGLACTFLSRTPYVVGGGPVEW